MSAESLHPEKARLVAFGLGKLALNEASEIENHLTECALCCETLQIGRSLMGVLQCIFTNTLLNVLCTILSSGLLVEFFFLAFLNIEDVVFYSIKITLWCLDITATSF